MAHGNPGRRPVNAAEPRLAKQVLEVAQTTYQGFNQHHLTETLAVREGFTTPDPRWSDG